MSKMQTIYLYNFLVNYDIQKNYFNNFEQNSMPDLNSGSAVHEINALD